MAKLLEELRKQIILKRPRKVILRTKTISAEAKCSVTDATENQMIAYQYNLEVTFRMTALSKSATDSSLEDMFLSSMRIALYGDIQKRLVDALYEAKANLEERSARSIEELLNDLG